MFGWSSMRSVIRLNPLFQFEKEGGKKREKKNDKNNHRTNKKLKKLDEYNAFPETLDHQICSISSQAQFGIVPRRNVFDDKYTNKQKSWFHTENEKDKNVHKTPKAKTKSCDSDENPSDSNDSGIESGMQLSDTRTDANFYYLRKYRKSRNQSRKDKRSEVRTSEEKSQVPNRKIKKGKRELNDTHVDVDINDVKYASFDSVRDYHETQNILTMLRKYRQKQSKSSPMFDIDEEGAVQLVEGRSKAKYYYIGSCLVFWLCNPIFGGSAFSVSRLGFDNKVLPDEQKRMRKTAIALNIIGVVISLVIVVVVLAVYYTNDLR